jgi:hypothetical protein
MEERREHEKGIVLDARSCLTLNQNRSHVGVLTPPWYILRVHDHGKCFLICVV